VTAVAKRNKGGGSNDSEGSEVEAGVGIEGDENREEEVD